MNVVRRVPCLHAELARRERDLRHHEIGVQVHDLAVDPLPRFREQLDGLRLGELDADLGDDPPPATVEYRYRVRRQDLVPRHLVDEHLRSPDFREDWDDRRLIRTLDRY